MKSVPVLPRILGLAGLLPQLACLLAIAFGGPEWRWTALALAWAYAALIFTFLGGMWWGFCAARGEFGRAPSWLWIASVIPSLVALATFVPWIFGQEWPGPSLLVLGIGIIGSLLVDRRIGSNAPKWWLALRIPLSLGLGAMTLVIALTALIMET